MSPARGADAWAEVALDEVCDFAYGKSLPAKARTGSGYPVYGSNGPVGFHKDALTDGETIVIGRKGSFGEVHYSAGPCFPIDTTYYITRRHTEAHLPWLARRLRDLGLDRLNRAAAIPGLNRADAYRQQLLLPPLAEQKRIAAILDAADALRQKRRESLAQLDILLQSTFLDMFGDPVANPMGWLQKPLGDALHPDRPLSYGILKPGDYEEAGVIMLRIQDIRGGEVGEEGFHRVTQSLSNQYKRTLLSGGEIVISLVGTVGLCALVPSRFSGANVHRNLAVVVPGEGLRARYLRQYMASPWFQRLIKEATKGGNQSLLNLGDLKRLPVLVPSIQEQDRFCGVIAAVERQRALQRTHLTELESLFNSLQQRAFAGELAP